MPRVVPRARGAALRLARAAGAALISAACRPAAPPPVVGPVPAAAVKPDRCVLVQAELPAETVTVALYQPVVPAHAPVPTNDAERLLFRQLYETLVRMDCGGAIRPGLAAGWTADSGGRRWRFELRADARFGDGSPLDAASVQRAWARQGDQTGRIGWAAIASVEVENGRTLAVTFDSAHAEVPGVLADPRLAPTRSPADARGSNARAFDAWAVGAGGYRLEEIRADTILARPTAGSRPVLRFRVAEHGDPRDGLDAGAGLLITRDPAALEYAGAHPELDALPLGWDRLYVLLQPADTAPGPIFGGAAAFRAALARDAVRAEARAPDDPGCGGDSAAPALTRGRLVYPRDDPTAADLADRLAALGGPGAQVSAVGLEEREFAAALRSGGAAGYLLSLGRDEAGRCDLLPSRPPGYELVPLVETRARVVARRGVATLLAEWGGNLRIVSDGAERDGAEPDGPARASTP